jgi:hypothetical protein
MKKKIAKVILYLDKHNIPLVVSFVIPLWIFVTFMIGLCPIDKTPISGLMLFWHGVVKEIIFCIIVTLFYGIYKLIETMYGIVIKWAEFHI